MPRNLKVAAMMKRAANISRPTRMAIDCHRGADALMLIGRSPSGRVAPTRLVQVPAGAQYHSPASVILVISAKAGIHRAARILMVMDPGLRRDDVREAMRA